MKLNAASVGIRIRQARVTKGWTQTELANALGVQRSSVGRWETGRSVPTCIPRLATTLGQEAEWFMAKADEGTLPSIEDTREIKLLRTELRRLSGNLKAHPLPQKPLGKPTAPPVVTQAPVVAAVVPVAPVPTTTVGNRPLILTQNFKDHSVLTDVLAAWNRVNPETRLLVALLITGDWSYKLKIWNKDVAIDDSVLKAIGEAHKIVNG